MANVWGCGKRKSGVTISLQNNRKWHFYGSCRKQSKKVGNKEGKHFVCHKNMIFLPTCSVGAQCTSKIKLHYLFKLPGEVGMFEVSPLFGRFEIF